VTTTGFEWQFDEWDYQDGVHAQEQVHYVVAEEGCVPLPPQLFSHSDQQVQWQSFVPDHPFRSG